MRVLQFQQKGPRAFQPRPDREKKNLGWVLVLGIIVCAAGELYGCWAAFH